MNGQPILLSDVEERVGPELARLMTQPSGAQRDKDRESLLRRGLSEMVDEKLIEALRKRMEGYTGPVLNKGGVR